MNYVALLVCSAPEGVDEVASLSALASRFSLSMLSSGQQRFDRGKLDYLSRRHLERLDPLDLASRVGRVLELRGVGFHPAQLTALAEGLRGAHTLSEAADESEQILKRRPAPTDIDERGRRVLALFCTARAGWHEPYLAPREAEELLARGRGAGEGGRHPAPNGAALAASRPDRSRAAASACPTWSRRSSARTRSRAAAARWRMSAENVRLSSSTTA